jgi:hypothetical protein
MANEESPYCGTRKFGMCYVNQEGGLAGEGPCFFALPSRAFCMYYFFFFFFFFFFSCLALATCMLTFCTPFHFFETAIGTTLEITEHERVKDGRMLINNTGVERFKIVSVKQETPVLICEVRGTRWAEQ